ncbi:MAG: hypothetical protein AAFV62_09170 [Pseudomonadota bacterium]
MVGAVGGILLIGAFAAIAFVFYWISKSDGTPWGEGLLAMRDPAEEAAHQVEESEASTSVKGRLVYRLRRMDGAELRTSGRYTYRGREAETFDSDDGRIGLGRAARQRAEDKQRRHNRTANASEEREEPNTDADGNPKGASPSEHATQHRSKGFTARRRTVKAPRRS